MGVALASRSPARPGASGPVSLDPLIYSGPGSIRARDLFGIVDLDLEGVGLVADARTGADRQRDQAVDLRAELDVVAGPRVRILVERTVVGVQPGLHEEVEGIVNVIGRQLEFGDRRRQVLLASPLDRAAPQRLALPAAAAVEQVVRLRAARGWLPAHRVGCDR